MKFNSTLSPGAHGLLVNRAKLRSLGKVARLRFTVTHGAGVKTSHAAGAALFKGAIMFSTYLRLNVPVWASTRAVIRATYGRLRPSARAHAHRAPRHAIIREMLGHHARAQALHERVSA